MKRSLYVGTFAFALVVALLLAQGPSARGEDPAKPSAATSRTFSFEYVAKVPAPADAKRLDVWVPLPIEDDLQKVADLKLERTAEGSSLLHRYRCARDQPHLHQPEDQGIAQVDGRDLGRPAVLQPV